MPLPIGNNASSARRLVDERVYTYIPEDALDGLIAAFLRSINQRLEAEPDGRTPAETAWCRCVFALIAIGGLAGPQALEEILELRYRDLRPAGSGYIQIPRAGGYYHIYVPEPAAPFILSLLNHLTRGRGPGRNRQGEYPADGFVLPGRPDPASPVTLDEERRFQEVFRSWLRQLGESIGVNLPVGRLIALARGRVLRDYSPPIAAALLGLHLLNPTPANQDNEIGAYRDELNWQWIIDPARADKGGRKRTRTRHSNQDQPDKVKFPKDLPAGLCELRGLITDYGKADKSVIRSARRQVAGRLIDLANKEESEAGKPTSEDWPGFFQRHTGTGFTWEQVDAINTCLLSRWLIVQTKSHALNTAIARLADILRVIQQQPGGMLIHWDEEGLLKAISELMVAPSRRERIADSWKQFYRFLNSSLGIRVPDIAAWRLRNRPVIKEYRLLAQHGFERLLAYLFRIHGVGPVAVAALLIGYYFGLRVSEICHLRIGNLWLGGTPTVLVRSSKRRRSRFVEGVQIPAGVIQFLQELRTARLEGADGDYSALLLVAPRNRRLTRYRLMCLMHNALAAVGIGDGEDHPRSAMHLLRHACANRWWALGVPLIDIAHKLGHRSPDTTIRNYLHIAPFLQREECLRITGSAITFTKKDLASFLGITLARLGQLERTLFSRLNKNQAKEEEGYSLGNATQTLEQFLKTPG